MYLGRMLACGRDAGGSVYLHYRVNSRSFKNRVLKLEDGRVGVVPASRDSADFENPYVTYNCCRKNQNVCVISNGAQTDPVFEKCVRGASPRDAIASVLMGMDYEFDGHDTPRIVLYANAESGTLYFGIVTNSSLQIEKVEPAAGELLLVSTNEYNYLDRNRRLTGYAAPSFDAAVSYLESGAIFRSHEHGVLGLTVKLERGFPAAGRSLQVAAR
ncbi:MAG TPA: IMP cyclohydrolase [Polyangiaceae bacterium]|nr:IMP cyclohydrolase [Polyangiaceae bacterium]